jgi:gluconolactonase
MPKTVNTSRSQNGTLIGLASIEIVVDGLDHPECVAVGPDGVLHCGGEAGQIYRLDPSAGTATELASTGGLILGVALDGAGNVIACDARRQEVVLCSPTGRLHTLSAGSPGRPMTTPNFAVLHEAGAYVSDSGEWGEDDGRIYAIGADGSTELWTESLAAFPNGMALDATDQALYVALSTEPAVWRLPIGADGSAGTPELVVELPGTVPDGLAFDVAGGLYISCYRPDRIYRLDPDGALEVVAEDFQGTTVAAQTNIAFGGPELRSLFIASLARWHVGRLPVDTPGLPLRYPTIETWGRADV